MELKTSQIEDLTGFFENEGLLPTNAKRLLLEMADDQFVFHDQLLK